MGYTYSRGVKIMYQVSVKTYNRGVKIMLEILKRIILGG